MKALRVPVPSLSLGELSLDAEASNYVLRVHRRTVGDPLVLFEPHAAIEADARLKTVRGKVAICQIESIRASTAVPTWPLVLIQSYAKGDKVEHVIKDATALGVTEVVVVVTARSIVSVRQDEVEHRRERFERIAIDAARQCGRGDVPKITGPIDWTEYLTRIGALPAERLVLSPEGHLRMSEWMHATATCPVALFIGPEGGFDERELDGLRASNFREIRFGDFVLRTEVAATSVLGAITVWQQR